MPKNNKARDEWPWQPPNVAKRLKRIEEIHEWRNYTPKEEAALKAYRIRRAIVRQRELKQWQHDPFHDTWMP